MSKVTELLYERIAKFAHERVNGKGSWDALPTTARESLEREVYQEVFKADRVFCDPYLVVVDGCNRDIGGGRIRDLTEAREIARAAINENCSASFVREVVECEISYFYTKTEVIQVDV